LLDVHGDILSDEEKEGDTVSLKLAIIKKGGKVHSQQTNEIYLSYIRQLKTHQIELIIEAYTKGKQYRSAATIDVLMSELLERATNPETRKKRGKTK
jgi:hypothetical protein